MEEKKNPNSTHKRDNRRQISKKSNLAISLSNQCWDQKKKTESFAFKAQIQWEADTPTSQSSKIQETSMRKRTNRKPQEHPSVRQQKPKLQRNLVVDKPHPPKTHKTLAPIFHSQPPLEPKSRFREFSIAHKRRGWLLAFVRNTKIRGKVVMRKRNESLCEEGRDGICIKILDWI